MTILKAMVRPTVSGKSAIDRVCDVRGEFTTVNIDLIFNFPFQTLEVFKKDVAVFKQFQIDQATFYPLMPSPHKKEALERRFDRVDYRSESRYYAVILNEILDAGFKPSTTWCFSRGSRMIDEYIVDYADYICIGAGSVSLINGIFYVNSFTLEGYSNKIKTGRLPVALSRRLSPKEYLRYFLLTKLFGTRVDTAQFKQQFGTDINNLLGTELRLLRLAGAITENAGIIQRPGGMYICLVMMRESRLSE
jgi:coproporphyrinogen III oxidase-like Fe-S oxidoreductase